jgi:hypothetical protein
MIIAFCVSFCSHTNSDTENNNETFSKFLEKFSSDSTFQYSRLRFPIKNDVYNTDTGLFESHLISQNEWKFSNLNDPNFIKSVKRESDNKTILNIQIEDTGVSILYNFEIFDGLWYLNKIVDEST